MATNPKRYSVETILNRARDLEIMLSLRNGNLAIQSHKPIPDNAKSVFREYKSELVAYLEAQTKEHEPTEEELFRAMPPEAQQAYLAALAEPIPCSLCLDEGIITPLEPGQEVCPRHAPAAPQLTPDEIIQRFNALPDMVVSEVIPIEQEAAMKARVEQEYRDRDRYLGRQVTRSVFDYKKQPRWEERRYRKELQESINQAINKSKQVSVDNVPAPEQLV